MCKCHLAPRTEMFRVQRTPSLRQQFGQLGNLMRLAEERETRHRVQGEATLNVKLAKGLQPDGGVKTKGNLFKEIKLASSATPCATMPPWLTPTRAAKKAAISRAAVMRALSTAK